MSQWFLSGDKFEAAEVSKDYMLHLHLQEQIGRQEVNLSPALEQISNQEADFI